MQVHQKIRRYRLKNNCKDLDSIKIFKKLHLVFGATEAPDATKNHSVWESTGRIT